MGKNQEVRVRRDAIAACMTCPLCNKLVRDATTISECLHTCEPLRCFTGSFLPLLFFIHYTVSCLLVVLFGELLLQNSEFLFLWCLYDFPQSSRPGFGEVTLVG